MRASAMQDRCKEWGASQCRLSLNHSGDHDFTSNRKPYNGDAGYISSLRSGVDRGWVVIYEAKEQGLDDADGRYAVTCQTHHQIVNATSLPKARSSMRHPENFCSECWRLKGQPEVKA